MKVKIGSKFGKLEIVKLLRTEKFNNGQNKYIWLCQCDCGNTCEKSSKQLLEAKMPSCGCVRARTTHGLSKTRLHRIWKTMKCRCYGKKWRHFKTYHKNKIKMCDEWKNSFVAFYNWSMANGYEDSLSIDRINNLGNYEPSNCRWVDKITQANNTSRNVWIFYNGETHTIAQWRRILNIGENAMRYRISKGWGCRVSKP